MTFINGIILAVFLVGAGYYIAVLRSRRGKKAPPSSGSTGKKPPPDQL